MSIEYRKEGASYCVYVHRRATDNAPYYVGISGNRFRPYDLESRTQLHKNITNKYGACVEIVAEGLTMMEAISIETELIKTIGRICDKSGPLANFKVNHWEEWPSKSTQKSTQSSVKRSRMSRKRRRIGSKVVTDNTKRLSPVDRIKKRMKRNKPTKQSNDRESTQQ